MEKKAADELLFKALSKLLHKKSIDKLSVQEILDESGVSRATFYRHYRDKYDLLNSNYRKILEDTLFRFNEGFSYIEAQLRLYQVIKDNIKLFQNAIRSSDVNSLKNFIFDVSMDFHLKVLEKNGIDITDWKVRKKLESYIDGNLEIVVIWILEGAKEPIADLIEVLSSMLPLEFRVFSYHRTNPNRMKQKNLQPIRNRNYSYLKASTGLILAALVAG